MNLGIYGGTFNPPHLGHLIVAESVRDQLRLDKILFTPSFSTPNKYDPLLAPAPDRLAMTQLAIEGNPDFEISDLEIRRTGLSYTIDTIMGLENLFPESKLSLLIGSDNFLDFQSWKSPREILARVQLVVMNRPGIAAPPARNEYSRLVTFVNVPQIGISGTDIRRRIKLQRSIRYLVPRSVEEYILRHKLFQD